jgi:hypothetical protein
MTVLASLTDGSFNGALTTELHVDDNGKFGVKMFTQEDGAKQLYSDGSYHNMSQALRAIVLQWSVEHDEEGLWKKLMVTPA